MQEIAWLGLIVMILGEVSRRAETFYILENGVARSFRLLSTAKEFTEYEKIQNVEVRQSFFERIFRVGNLHFDTSGGDHTEINFKGIRSPYTIESIVRERMISL